MASSALAVCLRIREPNTTAPAAADHDLSMKNRTCRLLIRPDEEEYSKKQQTDGAHGSGKGITGSFGNFGGSLNSAMNFFRFSSASFSAALLNFSLGTKGSRAFASL